MNMLTHTIRISLLAVCFMIPLTAAADRYGSDDGFYSSGDYYADEGYYDYDASDPFFDLLVDYGDWIAMAEYGLVWRPHGTPLGWRPYTYGRWVATDAGWTWVSDWQWGWAPFHYGRWLQHHRIGWVWVPGDEWAPAWVDWREGDGLIGWAPLPPHVGWGPSIGLSLIFIDGDIVRPASDYYFVRYNTFLEPHVHRHILPRRRNISLINSTRNVTSYVVVNRRVVNRSVDVDRLSRALRRPIRRHRIVEHSDAHVRPDRALRGDELQVFRPKLRRRDQPQRRARVETRKRRGLDADRDRRVDGPSGDFRGRRELVPPEVRRDAAPRSPQHYSPPRERRPAETASRRDSKSRAKWTTERSARPRARDDGRPDARVRRTEQTRKAAPAETRPSAAAKRSGTPRARREPAPATHRNARLPQRSTARQERSSARRSNQPLERQRRDGRASTSRPRAAPQPPRAERSRSSAAPRAAAPARDAARVGREGAKRSDRHSGGARQSAGSPRERGRRRERED